MQEAKQLPVVAESLLGIWHSKYRYPSNSRRGIYESEHFVRLSRRGDQLVFESLPNANKSHVIMHLSIDGSVATGTWREETHSGGYYRGAVYSGAIQLAIEDDGLRMRGKWVGIGKRMTVNVGAWEFTFVGKKLPIDLS